ncbi:hypothetical protein NFI96_027930 [Prochilodus magdalenae]|nr:hypothetical protein NFI96_027930 [Prochilodus magdalenae]
MLGRLGSIHRKRQILKKEILSYRMLSHSLHAPPVKQCQGRVRPEEIYHIREGLQKTHSSYYKLQKS